MCLKKSLENLKIKNKNYNDIDLIGELYSNEIVSDMEASEEYKDLMKQYNNLYDSIEETELKDKFMKLEEIKNNIYSENDKMIFRAGFSTATKMILEALK